MEKLTMIVTVLGTEYRIHESSPAEDPVLKDADGYCDPSIKLCVIDSFKEESTDSLKDLEAYKRKTARHELIHAFLFESGLGSECSWACEEMVDWLARQLPKLVTAFTAAGCMETDET